MESTEQHLEALLIEATQAMHATTVLSEVEHLRTTYLGKKGQLTEILKHLGTLSPKERVRIGKSANVLKQTLLDLFHSQTVLLQKAAVEKQLREDTIDITLPGRLPKPRGSVHPV